MKKHAANGCLRQWPRALAGYFFLMSSPGEAVLVETSFPVESRVVLNRSEL